MHLLLLSLGDGAVERFISDTVGRSPRDTTIGYVSGAGRELFEDRGFRVVDFASDPEAVDAVYVGGGNTFTIWHELRASGMDRVLDERIRGDLPYIGLSAGSVIAGPDIEPSRLLDDPAEAPALESNAGFGWIADVPIPHAGGMLPAYPSALIDQTFARFGDRFPLLALDDDQALVVHDGTQEIIASP